MPQSDLANTIVECLEDYKAQDIQTLNISNLSDFADEMVICTANSTRHCQSLFNNLVSELKEKGIAPYHKHSAADNRWILLDYCDVVVHIMLEEARSFYELEKLWTEVEAPIAAEA